MMKSQNKTQKWIIKMKSLKNTTKSIEQTIRIYRWSKDLEGLSDEENIE